MQIHSSDDGDDDPEVMVEMNTTPLIDVMLVLLVMLIITIPIQLHSVNLELPVGLSIPSAVEPEVVTLDITAANQVLWNGELIDDRQVLIARMLAAAERKEQPEIHLRPDRNARYDTVAAVLAASQRVGLSKIGMVGAEQFAP